jgi:hypothetical protein
VPAAEARYIPRSYTYKRNDLYLQPVGVSDC